MNLNFSAYSFQYPIKPNLSPFSSVEGEKLNAFYSIPLYINVSQLGIHYFLASIIFPVILFKKLMLKKKRQGKKNPISKQTKKLKKAGTEQCSGMKCCPAVLENQCHLEYWAPAEST